MNSSTAFTLSTPLSRLTTIPQQQQHLKHSSFTCSNHNRNNNQLSSSLFSTSSTTKATLSLDLFRAAAATITLTFSNIVYPTNPNNLTVNAHFHHQPQIQQPHQQYVIASSMSINSPTGVIGVSKSSIQNYKSANRIQSEIKQQQPQQQQQQLQQDDSSLQSSNVKGEFMLASRLITAVMMGVMLGLERNTTALNLGIRSISVITLSSAIFSLFLVYSDLLLLPLTTTTTITSYGYSKLAFVISNHMTPAVTALLLAVISSALVYTIVQLKCFYYNRFRVKKMKHIPFIKSMSAIIGLSVGMGIACGAGLGLMTAGFYLGGVAVMRNEHHQHSHLKSSSTKTLTSFHDKTILHSPTQQEQQLTSSNEKRMNNEDEEFINNDRNKVERPAVDSLL